VRPSRVIWLGAALAATLVGLWLLRPAVDGKPHTGVTTNSRPLSPPPKETHRVEPPLDLKGSELIDVSGNVLDADGQLCPSHVVLRQSAQRSACDTDGEARYHFRLPLATWMSGGSCRFTLESVRSDPTRGFSVASAAIELDAAGLARLPREGGKGESLSSPTVFKLVQDLRYPRGGSMTIVVTTEEAPLAGVDVSIRADGGELEKTYYRMNGKCGGVTNSEGRIVLNDLEQGIYSVLLHADTRYRYQVVGGDPHPKGSAWTVFRVLEGRDTSVLIRALAHDTIELLVTDQAGSAISGASCKLFDADAANASSSTEKKTDGSGKVRMYASSLTGKVAVLMVARNGYAMHLERLAVQQGRTEHAVALRPGGVAIRGAVRSNDGSALVGVQVTISCPGIAKGSLVSQTTDGEGRFEFSFLTSGEYALSSSLTGHTQSTDTSKVTAPNDGVVIILRSPGIAPTTSPTEALTRVIDETLAKFHKGDLSEGAARTKCSETLANLEKALLDAVEEAIAKAKAENRPSRSELVDAVSKQIGRLREFVDQELSKK